MIVASFSHQIQSEYYGGNRLVSNKGILLEHFNALPQTEINLSKKSFPRHALFKYFSSDDSKRYAAITIAHSKFLIELLRFKKVLASLLGTI